MAAIVGATVPDYRGLFLRGHGSRAHAKNNGAKNGVTTTVHASADIGVIQGDAIRNIKATTDFWDYPLQVWDNNTRAYGLGAFEPLYAGPGALWAASHDTNTKGYEVLDMDASRIVPTATENRPVNTAVKYIIFAGD